MTTNEAVKSRKESYGPIKLKELTPQELRELGKQAMLMEVTRVLRKHPSAIEQSDIQCALLYILGIYECEDL